MPENSIQYNFKVKYSGVTSTNNRNYNNKKVVHRFTLN